MKSFIIHFIANVRYFAYLQWSVCDLTLWQLQLIIAVPLKLVVGSYNWAFHHGYVTISVPSSSNFVPVIQNLSKNPKLSILILLYGSYHWWNVFKGKFIHPCLISEAYVEMALYVWVSNPWFQKSYWSLLYCTYKFKWKYNVQFFETKGKIWKIQIFIMSYTSLHKLTIPCNFNINMFLFLHWLNSLNLNTHSSSCKRHTSLGSSWWCINCNINTVVMCN